jgi:hypothetical protein
MLEFLLVVPLSHPHSKYIMFMAKVSTFPAARMLAYGPNVLM